MLVVLWLWVMISCECWSFCVGGGGCDGFAWKLTPTNYTSQICGNIPHGNGTSLITLFLF